MAPRRSTWLEGSRISPMTCSLVSFADTPSALRCCSDDRRARREPRLHRCSPRRMGDHASSGSSAGSNGYFSPCALDPGCCPWEFPTRDAWDLRTTGDRRCGEPIVPWGSLRRRGCRQHDGHESSSPGTSPTRSHPGCTFPSISSVRPVVSSPEQGTPTVSAQLASIGTY